jgi:uncharacterized protein (TIRG00374 family)
MASQTASRPVARWIKVLVALTILAGAVMVSVGFAGLFDDAWDVMLAMNWWWLAVALGCEVVAYGWRALHVRYVVRAGGQARRAAPIRTALVLFGLGSVLPAAPLEGFAMTTAALRRRRVDTRRIAVLLGFSQWFSLRGLLALASVDALVAVSLSHMPDTFVPLAVGGSVAILAMLAATNWLALQQRVAELVGLVTLRVRHWGNAPHPAERRARGAAWHAAAMKVAGRRFDRLVLVGTCVAAWMFDGLCLYFALRATGADVDLDVLLLAFAVGNLASMIPLLPAGVGVVESVTPLVLHAYGVPLPMALAAVVGFRLLATVLPAIAGTVALAGMRVGGPAPTATTAAA